MDDRFLKRAILLSLLIHGVFLLSVTLWSVIAPEKNYEQPSPIVIEVDPLPDKSKRQIVDSKSGEEVKEAPKDSYLGEKNRVVDKEKIARQRGQRATSPQPKPETPQRKLTRRERERLVPKKGPLSRFAVAMIPKPQERRPANAPSWTKFSAQYGSAYPEYVKGVQEGETTALNTQEFVYFAYYKRIRDRLDQAWRPLLRDHLYRIYRAGRRIAANMDHITRTLVTLSKGGDVVRVQVMEESGIRDLDNAAIEAFNKAGPFPNPPTGLVEASTTGEITIRWDFILRS